jgi:hypothetical protein
MRTRARGSVLVELVMILPLIAVLLATIEYMREHWLTVFSALHAAETAAWTVAMSNQRDACGESRPGPFRALSVGELGAQTTATALVALPKLSFFYERGGARTEATRSIANPPWPLGAARISTTTRADYMPCNETVGDNDGALPAAFDAVWLQHAGPR